LSIRTLKTPIQLHSLFDQYLAGGCFHSDPLDGLFDAIDPSPFREPRTCPVTQRLRWSRTSIAIQVYPTRLLFCETRCMSEFNEGSGARQKILCASDEASV